MVIIYRSFTQLLFIEKEELNLKRKQLLERNEESLTSQRLKTSAFMLVRLHENTKPAETPVSSSFTNSVILT